MAKKRVKGKTLGGFAQINHDAAGIDVGNAQRWMISDPIGALAHLQPGRAYALSGDKTKAKAA